MERNIKTLAIVQARMGSTRFPNKVMHLINNVPMIELLLKRLSLSKRIDKIIIATSVNLNNEPMVEHLNGLGFDVFQGDEDNVLERFFLAAQPFKPETIIRITGDCPLVDSALVDEIIDEYNKLGVDYLSNIAPPTYPDGMDIEVFSFKALCTSMNNTINEFDKEHVTPYIRNSGLFSIANYSNDNDFSEIRLTVDEKVDFEVITNIYDHFHPEIVFTWKQVIQLYEKNPKLFMANKKIARNEGVKIGSGQKLWKRAKTLIPGGNMLLSKRAEMFLPDQWPAYFSKAKGCKVWDLDDKEYIDMSIMGIGTNTLGYGHQNVDDAVMKTVIDGNMSTLNCPEEVYLAEKLVEMNPWADMVRFARSGGEANSIAIRIARAASGKDKVAICGYHGWHDWYLSANHNSEDSLSGHLLPGLNPSGVPKALKDTVFPFHYNNFGELQGLVENHEIGVIKMEVVRNFGPEDNFLHKVRDLATRKNIVLIFDECTSGFRETFGGIYMKYGVEPDMAMYGKTIGNGYALTAVVGKKSVMEAAQTSFISSTFWTERIGPTAALATLRVMEEIKSWDIITEIGKKIQSGWKSLALVHGLEIEVAGIPSLSTYSFKSENALAYKTLIAQEMLKKNMLASTNFYASIAHEDIYIEKYFSELDKVYGLIKKCENQELQIDEMLEGPICHSGFKRLN